ncbi:uncharacterized protein LOC121372286 [Gigantopelta aegis]|uniref:uncharacterized protein LOC121372286 n=1 Tax=Gigantopelta aegis TaxID=1735272 RepID=UPI001B88C1F5|nr:uncharacterized protein LOC121372286 [Gigantopelta aegis]
MAEHGERVSTNSAESSDDKALSLIVKTPSPSDEVPGTFGTGVVRRRSVRRRISRDDGKPKNYGQNKEEYEKIVERVLCQKSVANALDALRERWKMLMFMYEDCMEMVKSVEDKRQKMKTKEKRIEICILVTGIISIVIPMVLIVWRWG